METETEILMFPASIAQGQSRQITWITVMIVMTITIKFIQGKQRIATELTMIATARLMRAAF